MVERRQSTRVVVQSPVLVSLGGGKAGLLFDVGEGGLSIRGVISKRRQDPISVAFDLTSEDDPVYAWARVAWTSDTKNRTGLHFVKVAERTQRRLKTWVGSKFETTTLCAADGASKVISFPGIDSTVIPPPAQIESESPVAEVAPKIPSRPSLLSRIRQLNRRKSRKAKS